MEFKESYLGNALVLDLARMLKSTIHDGSQDLGLEQEISETAAVNRDIVSLDGALFLGLNSILGSLGLYIRKILRSCNGFNRVKMCVVSHLLSGLLFLVVQKIFVDISISHCCV